MAFAQDYGTCCFILPLKLGVALIAMFTLATGLMSIIGIMINDIRFQPNGYNPMLYYLPSVVSSFGLYFGFVGLLGVYDDKLSWVRYYTNFLFVKILASVAAMVFDFMSLRQCEDWLKDPSHTEESTPQMNVFAKLGICQWARYSYVVGCSIDLALNSYFTYVCFAYYKHLMLNPPYALDFGLERGNVEAKWWTFKVSDPREETALLTRIHQMKEAREDALQEAAAQTAEMEKQAAKEQALHEQALHEQALHDQAMHSQAMHSYGSMNRTPVHLWQGRPNAIKGGDSYSDLGSQHL
eukprot:TRINITY_DN62164_c0_g1_i1.p1 TRINITY_DN62164_c0_g1~~TRINITY_DN62164_c0_g1_i1.p1  ORF type:complete len:335 (-),score=60.07 TRINITY_DN62164_c0_g1_i1:98-985(-)